MFISLTLDGWIKVNFGRPDSLACQKMKIQTVAIYTDKVHVNILRLDFYPSHSVCK